jgi:hypothetical protein
VGSYTNRDSGEVFETALLREHTPAIETKAGSVDAAAGTVVLTDSDGNVSLVALCVFRKEYVEV